MTEQTDTNAMQFVELPKCESVAEVARAALHSFQTVQRGEETIWTLRDGTHEWADAEVPIWNSTRAEWLASNLRRAGYVDDAHEELGGDFSGVYQLIGVGMYEEIREVGAIVLNRLRELVTE